MTESASFELRLGKTISDPLASDESFEMLRYTFKPESISKRPGRLWRTMGKSDGEQKYKTLAAFEGDAGEAKSVQRFSGSFTAQKESINECVVVVQGGKAILHRLSGSTKLNHLPGSNAPKDFPTSCPAPLPEGHKRKLQQSEGVSDSDGAGGAGSRNVKPVHDASLSSEDESSDDSDSSEGESYNADRPPLLPGGGGKGLLTAGGASQGGGKGLSTLGGGGGKGLLLKNGPPQATRLSSEDEDSDDSDDDDDSD